MAYDFDPDRIHAIGRDVVAHPEEQRIEAAIREMARAYPDEIDVSHGWLYSLFGGSTSAMKILHASLTEYVAIFGTPIGTGGYSGRYWLEIYDTVLSGEMWTFTIDDPTTAVVARTGDPAYLARGQSKGWRLTPGAWLLEYGRGLLPTALPNALSDSVFSAMDPLTIAQTLGLYAKSTLKHLLRGKI